MLTNLVFPLGLLLGITAWMVMVNTLRERNAREQQEIASRGAQCQGRVVAIQRPFLLDSCTRLYFDFSPSGAQLLLRGCHVAHHASLFADLPNAGALVTVQYLPERPQRAVIGKLVTG